ncbi:hypothetical protein ECPA10_3230, partial [Escherichia coli PA10]
MRQFITFQTTNSGF